MRTAIYSCLFYLCRWTYNTPPDSPRCIGQYNEIIQEIDIYALHSIEGELIKQSK